MGGTDRRLCIMPQHTCEAAPFQAPGNGLLLCDPALLRDCGHAWRASCAPGLDPGLPWSLTPAAPERRAVVGTAGARLTGQRSPCSGGSPGLASMVFTSFRIFEVGGFRVLDLRRGRESQIRRS